MGGWDREGIGDGEVGVQKDRKMLMLRKTATRVLRMEKCGQRSHGESPATIIMVRAFM